MSKIITDKYINKVNELIEEVEQSINLNDANGLMGTGRLSITLRNSRVSDLMIA